MIPDAQGLGNLESSTPGGVRASRRGTGGVDDCGTAEEDGPVTWEAPVRPVGGSGRRRTGDPLRRAVGSERSGGRLLGRRRPEGHRTHARPTGRRDRGQTGGRAEAGRGVGWLHTSDEGGERGMAPGPSGAKAASVEVNFRREPWPRAQTEEPMSPGLLKVAERAGQCLASRLSGGAEWWKSPCSDLRGPGWATARATRPASAHFVRSKEHGAGAPRRQRLNVLRQFLMS
jgi:hypothetical protein